MSIEHIKTTPYDDQKPGTSGLRKRVTTFQQPNYTANFIQAILLSIPGGAAKSTLVVGGDGRYYSKEAIQTIVELAAGNEVSRLIIGQGGILSTPAASNLIRKRKATGGILLTASHNPGGPKNDFGIKYNIGNGGPAPESITDQIYENAKSLTELKKVVIQGLALNEIGSHTYGNLVVEVVDPVHDYVVLMKEIFDFEAIKSFLHSNPSFTILFDAMHAVTGPYAKRIFIEELQLPESSIINAIPKEDFNGGHPDPNLTYAHELVELVEKNSISFGAASDGDGDRNMIIGKGTFVNPSDSVAIIAANAKAIPYFRDGIKGLARSMPTSAAIDRVAQKMGYKIFEVPTGWKFFGNLMDAGLLSICGEESFGTGSDHIREKDGLWAVLAWLSIVAHEYKQQPNSGLGDILNRHYAVYGRNYFSRYDFEEVDGAKANEMMEMLRANTDEFVHTVHGPYVVAQCDDFSYIDPIDGSVSKKQGLRILFTDGSRIIFRLSGTGSQGATIRLYVEKYAATDYDRPTAEAIKDLIDIALKVSKLTEYTGRTEPTDLFATLMGLFFNREVFRLKSRRAAYKILLYILNHFLFVIYLLGICALGVLPHKIAHEAANADEKALLIGQVNRIYTEDDTRLGLLPQNFGKVAPDQRMEVIQHIMDSYGLDTSLQRFSLQRSTKNIKGTNVHGIMRAPRGESSEAIVLSAPHFFDGKFNQGGIQLLMSFAKFALKHSFWSKDLIFLVTEQGAYGAHAWLEAYHGGSSVNGTIGLNQGFWFDDLKNGAGSIISALNFEFEGTDEKSIGIYPIGLNGRLSNADLITTVIRAFQHSGINAVLHSPLEKDEPWEENYETYLKNLLSFAKEQAFGFPTHTHVIFTRYNIEAVTLTGVDYGGWRNLDTTHLAAGLEMTCRSLNNLMEKFHHAYWFYYMVDAYTFVPISKYMIPIAIVIATSILGSLGIWWDSAMIKMKEYKPKQIKWDYQRRPPDISSFSNRIRPLYMPLLTLSCCFLFCGYLLKHIDTISFLMVHDMSAAFYIFISVMIAQQTLTWFLVPLIQRVFAGESGSSRSTVAGAWYILKCFIYGLQGMFWLALCTSNPSLALAMAVPVIPVTLMIRPTTSFVFLVIQSVLLSLMSPPMILFIWGLLVQDFKTPLYFLADILEYWETFGALFLPWICILYWPINLAMQVLVTMEK